MEVSVLVAPRVEMRYPILMNAKTDELSSILGPRGYYNFS